MGRGYSPFSTISLIFNNSIPSTCDDWEQYRCWIELETLKLCNLLSDPEAQSYQFAWYTFHETLFSYYLDFLRIGLSSLIGFRDAWRNTSLLNACSQSFLKAKYAKSASVSFFFIVFNLIYFLYFLIFVIFCIEKIRRKKLR